MIIYIQLKKNKTKLMAGGTNEKCIYVDHKLVSIVHRITSI